MIWDVCEPNSKTLTSCLGVFGTSIFGRIQIIWFAREKKPNTIDSLLQCVKSFAEGYRHIQPRGKLERMS